MPDSEIKTGENLVVSADCRHCDLTKTRSEWKVKGIEQAVSGDDYYRIPAEHILKEISITATAVNADGVEGDSITRIYALNRIKEIVGGGSSFAAIKADGSVVTWGNLECGGNSSMIADELINVQAISAAYGAFAANQQPRAKASRLGSNSLREERYILI